MLADRDLRHKLRIEDQCDARPLAGRERRVVVALAPPEPPPGRVDGQGGHHQKPDLVEGHRRACRLLHPERSRDEDGGRPAELQRPLSRYHGRIADLATLCLERGGRRCRAAFGGQGAVERHHARAAPQCGGCETVLCLDGGGQELRRAGLRQPVPELRAEGALPVVKRRHGEKKREPASEAGSLGKPPPWPCEQHWWCPALWQVGSLFSRFRLPRWPRRARRGLAHHGNVRTPGYSYRARGQPPITQSRQGKLRGPAPFLL